MNDFIQIYLNSPKTNIRRIFPAKLIRKNKRGVVVELPDGRIIHRKMREVFSFRPTTRPPKKGVIIVES